MAERYLPKWAADEIADLKRELSDARTRIGELEATLSGSGDGVFRFGHLITNDDVILPKSVYDIRAKMPSGFEVRIADGGGRGGAGREGFLELMVVSHHGMLMIPQAANVIHIGPGRN